MVYDCKFDGRHKSRLVAGGNWTDPPKEDIYSGVIGMDTVRLAFALASVHKLKACAADVGNAFLYGKTKELVAIKAGPEFGDLAGKTLVIDKGLYGLKSSAARFHEHLAAKLRRMGFKASRADMDLWYRRVGDHYEYLATYVDDILVFSKDPMPIIEEIKRDYILKGIGVPEYYLGGNIHETDEVLREKGISTSISASTYIHNSLEKMERLLGNGPIRQCKTPMADNAHPEMDESALLSDEYASKYRAMIGSLNWIVTLGRIDIAYAVNAMARFNMNPREGHYEMAKRIFGYLRRYPDYEIRIDPNPHPRDLVQPDKRAQYQSIDWSEYYPDACEEFPPDQPDPVIFLVQTTVYVDADHAHDKLTRRSVTGVLLFVNNTPVKWISKRQNTVEASTYGSEMVAARQACELIIEYRYNLRMLGFELDGPTMMLGDNNAVVLSSTIPSSQLKKKHLSIAYHKIRECNAGQEPILEFYHIPSQDNLADLLTKPLSRMLFKTLVEKILHMDPEKAKAIETGEMDLGHVIDAGEVMNTVMPPIHTPVPIVAAE